MTSIDVKQEKETNQRQRQPYIYEVDNILMTGIRLNTSTAIKHINSINIYHTMCIVAYVVAIVHVGVATSVQMKLICLQQTSRHFDYLFDGFLVVLFSCIFLL